MSFVYIASIPLALVILVQAAIYFMVIYLNFSFDKNLMGTKRPFFERGDLKSSFEALLDYWTISSKTKAFNIYNFWLIFLLNGVMLVLLSALSLKYYSSSSFFTLNANFAFACVFTIISSGDRWRIEKGVFERIPKAVYKTIMICHMIILPIQAIFFDKRYAWLIGLSMGVLIYFAFHFYFRYLYFYDIYENRLFSFIIRVVVLFVIEIIKPIALFLSFVLSLFFILVKGLTYRSVLCAPYLKPGDSRIVNLYFVKKTRCFRHNSKFKTILVEIKHCFRSHNKYADYRENELSKTGIIQDRLGYGHRYCQYCQAFLKFTRGAKTLAIVFGDYPIKKQRRGPLYLKDVDFAHCQGPVDFSMVYIHVETTKPLLLEKFITFAVRHPPKHGLNEIQIFIKGNIALLEKNLKNLLVNNFDKPIKFNI